MLALRTARALRPALRSFSDASGGLQLSFAAPHTVYYFETSVASVTLPGASGEYGVTAGHSPLAEQLRPGVVAITHKTGEELEKFTGKLPIKPGVTIKLLAASARNEPFTTFTTAVKTHSSRLGWLLSI